MTTADPSARLAAGMSRGPAQASVLVGADLTVECASAAVRTLMGWEPSELIGLGAVELVHPEDLPALAVLLYDGIGDRVAGARGSASGVVRLRDALGDWCAMEVTASNLLADPEVAGIVCTLRDATERRLHDDVYRRLAGSDDLGHVLDSLAGWLSWQLDGCHVVIGAVDGFDNAVAAEAGARRAMTLLGAGTVEHFPIEHHRGGGRIEITTPAANLTAWQRGVVDRAVELAGLALSRDFGDAELRQAALVDPLTGVANRAGLDCFTDGGGDEHTRCALYVDLDDFKVINDTYGHGAGDLVLVEVARRLQHAVRSKDLVARVGGDEFVVVCVELPGEDVARTVAERLVRKVNGPFDADGLALVINASVGLAIAEPGEQLAELVEHADCALRAAKRDGKHRLASYSA